MSDLAVSLLPCLSGMCTNTWQPKVWRHDISGLLLLQASLGVELSSEHIGDMLWRRAAYCRVSHQ